MRSRTNRYESPSLAWEIAREVGGFLLTTARDLVFTPFISNRTAAALVLYSQAVFPFLTQHALPDGRAMLVDAGLDPAIIDELDAANARFVPNSALGTLIRASGTGLPTVMALFAFNDLMGENETNASAMRGFPYSIHAVTGLCVIKLPDPGDYDVRVLAHRLGDRSIAPEAIRSDLPLSAREAFWTVAFHEIRHCSDDNNGRPDPYGEADADLQAVRMAARVFGNPAIPAVFTHMRATHLTGGSHDNALYLDAILNGRPVPAPESIAAAGKELLEKIKAQKESMDNGSDKTTTLQALSAILAGPAHGLSPLAARRAQLYIDSHEYLTGQAVRAVPTPAP